MIRGVVSAAALLFWAAGVLSAQDGEAWYKPGCASCHEGGMDRGYTLAILHKQADGVWVIFRDANMLTADVPRA